MSLPFAGFEHIVRPGEPLAPLTSLGIGGPAEYFAEPTSVNELVALIKLGRELDMPTRVIGGGSNVLVRDEGVAGLVIHLSAPDFCSLSVQGETIQSGGGCRLSHFISLAVREGFSGPEQLAGIPGTIGGALHGNTDSHGEDIGQWVQSATVLTGDGEIHTRQRSELNFAYRESSLSELVVLSADFSFHRSDRAALTKRLQKQWIIRNSSQPMSSEHSGYIFKNPGGLTADSLIEQAGLKGSRMGEVELYQRNANFFVAHPGATCADVLKLIEVCKSQVSSQLGVELEVGIDIW